MNIALKEAGETDYWLDVIHSAGYFSDEEYTVILVTKNTPLLIPTTKNYFEY